MLVLMLFAFLAGIVTIVSPCVLPVLPLLLSTSVEGGRKRPLGIVLGLAATFTVVTLGVTAAADALAIPATWLRTTSIVMLLAFGLVMLVPQIGHAFERLASPVSRLVPASVMGGVGANRSGFGGGLLIGSGLGFLWAPCVGPIMGIIISLTALQGLTPQAVAITLAYSLGGSIPMLFIAYGARSLAARARKLAPQSLRLRMALGGLTVLACVGILFGFDRKLQDTMTSAFPGWSNTLLGIERQDSVDKELGNLQPGVAAQSNPAAQSNVVAQSNPASQPASDLPAVAAAPPTAAPPEPTAIPTQVPPTATAVQPTAVPPTAVPVRAVPALPDQGVAPELTGITGWFNTPGNKPLTINGLKGKVVLIDFWTFECYNCRNTRPYLRALYDKYHSQGLEIIGVHTPEFASERVPENVKNAAAEQKVNWPIAMDPDFKTWGAYNNRYWPALYFIDAKGHLRASYFGEGSYEQKDQNVAQLLAEAKQAGSK